MATAEVETEVAGQEEAPEQDVATKTPEQLFRYSTWVHIGPGSEECEDVDEEKGENTCANPLHFHGWCRLPNQFQHREIRDKALAAKARLARQLRDPLTDAAAIMEDDLDRLARAGDDAKEGLVEEISGKDWWKDMLEAAKDVAEIEAEKGDEKPYEHIERDQQRHRELAEMSEEDRPADEFGELTRHLEAYDQELEKAIEARVEPKRKALADRDIGDLIDMVRDDRIDRLSHDEFMHIYSVWEWYVGTRVSPGGEQRFVSMEQMKGSAPEVLIAVQEAFTDLEKSQSEGARGN